MEAPYLAGTYDLQVTDENDKVVFSFPITVSEQSATPPSVQQISGSWARFDSDGYNLSAMYFGEVYIFNQDGTFIHYFGSHSQTQASEVWKKGNYQINGSTLSFSNVVSVQFNRFSDEGHHLIGTRDYTQSVISQVPASGYSSSSMESKEVGLVSSGVLGLGRDGNGYFVEFRTNW